MPMDHNQQGRRGHFHRGRRGPDRRGPERRQGPSPDTQNNRPERTDRVDVEQIMRDIRSRIAQRSGIELSNQQIQELAARRLEAVLDPRGLNPALLDQLRRSAGERAIAPDAAPQQAETHPFDEASLYDSPNGLVRFLRRLLNPILRLFINPTPIAHALALQSRFQAELATREAERDRRQAEWNALHYQLLQRLVMEVSRVSIEAQSQALRIESLGAKVDFNERRVRAMEGSQAQTRPPRPQETTHAVHASSATPPADSGQPPTPSGSEGASGDQPRRRRRRRRGRRSSGMGAPADASTAASEASATNGAEEIDGDTDEGFEDDAAGPDVAGPETEAEPVRAESAPVQDVPQQPEPVAHQGSGSAPSPIQPPPIEPPQE
jgi:hypothetical protein